MSNVNGMGEGARIIYYIIVHCFLVYLNKAVHLLIYCCEQTISKLCDLKKPQFSYHSSVAWPGGQSVYVTVAHSGSSSQQACLMELGSTRRGRMPGALFSMWSFTPGFRAALPRGQATMCKYFQAFTCISWGPSYGLKKVIWTNPGSVGEDSIQDLGYWEALKVITGLIYHCTTSPNRVSKLYVVVISLTTELSHVWCDFKSATSSHATSFSCPPSHTALKTPLALPHGWVFIAVST